MVSHKRFDRLPLWLKILGFCIRSIPNFYKFKQGVVLASKYVTDKKGYKTIVKFDLGQKILLNLDDWIPLQIFWSGIYLTEKMETILFKKIVKRGGRSNRCRSKYWILYTYGSGKSRERRACVFF